MAVVGRVETAAKERYAHEDMVAGAAGFCSLNRVLSAVCFIVSV
jgi:hypothetical protein